MPLYYYTFFRLSKKIYFQAIYKRLALSKVVRKKLELGGDHLDVVNGHYVSVCALMGLGVEGLHVGVASSAALIWWSRGNHALFVNNGA